MGLVFRNIFYYAVGYNLTAAHLAANLAVIRRILSSDSNSKYRIICRAFEMLTERHF